MERLSAEDGKFKSLWSALALGLLLSLDCHAETIFVATNGSDDNTGVAGQPLRTIQAGIGIAVAGDVISIAPGRYAETLRTTRGGTQGQPIIIRSQEQGTVTVSANDDVLLKVSHPYVHVRGLVFDGQFAAYDLIRVFASGDYFMLDNCVIRNGKKDGIDLGNAATTVNEGFDFLVGAAISNSTFQNFLNRNIFGDRIDAHGIVAGGVIDLKISNTLVEMVSGDALQLANGNWDKVSVDSVIFRNAPIDSNLSALTNFPVGISPGEDAIDTKQDSGLPVRSRLTVRNSTFSGWSGDLISNAAALNIKEKVRVEIDGCTFFQNEIALRLRGSGSLDVGAHVTATNNVLYGNQRVVRIEDNLRESRLINNTFGAEQIFETVGGGAANDFFAANNLVSITKLPTLFSATMNLRVDNSSFAGADTGNYALVAGSPAIDSALTLTEIVEDHAGLSRPQGNGYDFGAFEYPVRVEQMPVSLWFQGLGASLLVLLHGRHALKWPPKQNT
ncbi:MAG: choice-of-anchor Q domain-containing protein [Gammaproteobacteria bacterium]